ncbi:MAG TPA: DUF488 domain-containing protein [Ktedonobacterales bacterium]|jgi:uncharacterized protein (DUF488 family)
MDLSATARVATPGTLWSIGHSNLTIERFIALLRVHAIAVLADVRTAPYSRHWPQFNREDLAHSLKDAGITYIFLGRELGGKPEDGALRGPHGLPDYDAIAATPLYQVGLARLMDLGAHGRTAFMCSEGDPARCHRERLVARGLRAAGWQVHHILGDGDIQGEVQASLW